MCENFNGDFNDMELVLENGNKDLILNNSTYLLGFPKGSIIIWSSATIPHGWQLCDKEQTINNVNIPNLKGKFVIGVGTYSEVGTIGILEYKMNQTGGSATHALTKEEMPSHNHIRGQISKKDREDLSGSYSANIMNTWYKSGTGTTSPIGGSIDMMQKASIASDKGIPHNNMPPYMALNFIIKVF